MPAPDFYYTRPENVRLRTGAGGVVARLDPKTGQVLIALIRDRGTAEYVLPKGGVEPGETHEQAAAREIAEEAGFTRLTLVAPLGKAERLTGKRHTWQTTHYFLFQTDQITGQPTDHRDWEVHWFGLDDLPQMYWREQADILSRGTGVIRDRVR
ncbi:MAG TPA: NUDIX domain-containing protein [Tepidisphaeraceae bacterium]|nr:NUDIX domain-containing protein [Tepidisphaeraceae bacterium]